MEKVQPKKEKNKNNEKEGFDWKLFWLTMGLIPIIAFYVFAALYN